MSDDVPLQLPRYVFRRANGSFRYKRNVPERLTTVRRMKARWQKHRQRHSWLVARGQHDFELSLRGARQ